MCFERRDGVGRERFSSVGSRFHAREQHNEKRSFTSPTSRSVYDEATQLLEDGSPAEMTSGRDARARRQQVNV